MQTTDARKRGQAALQHSYDFGGLTQPGPSSAVIHDTLREIAQPVETPVYNGFVTAADGINRAIRAHDPVLRPAHYTHSKIEVWDAIGAWRLNYFLGNVVKYVARADRKGPAVQDLEKARAYLDKEIARRKANLSLSHGDIGALL